MRFLLDIFMLLFISFFCFQFFRVLTQMRKEVVFPVSQVEVSAIRKHPEKVIRAPTYAEQKGGIIFCGCLLFIAVLFWGLGAYYDIYHLSFYLMIILIISYINNTLNLFAVNKDGILCGGKFVPWRNVKSFEFAPIDTNHKFYGYSREVNDRYELKIKTNTIPVNCIVTSEEMKERLQFLLEEKMKPL